MKKRLFYLSQFLVATLALTTLGPTATSNESGPSVSIVSPTPGASVGRTVDVNLAISNLQGFRIFSQRAEVCVGSASCDTPVEMKIGKAEGYGTGYLRFNSANSLTVVQKPGTYKIHVLYVFFSNAYADSDFYEVCNSIGHEQHCIYSSTAVEVSIADDGKPLAVPVETLIQSDTSYETKLNLECPKSLTKSTFTCTIRPVITPTQGISLYQDHTVTGTVKVSLCLFTSYAYRDLCSRLKQGSSTYDAQHKQVLGEVDLGKVTRIELPRLNSKYLELSVVSDGEGYDSLSWEVRAPAKKSLNVKVTGQNTVTYGQTTSFSISASPKIDTTCNVYRFNGLYTLVAKVKLKKGKGKGKHRWLWSDRNKVNAISLTVVCETSKYLGMGYHLVTAYPK